MKYLYISDLDGTLLNKEQEISARSKEILRRLIGNGLLFSVNTARSPVSAMPLLRGIGMTLPAVLMNGVMVYDGESKRPVDLRVMEKDTARRVIGLFEERGYAPYVYSYEDGIHLEYKKIHHVQSEVFFNQRREDYRSLGSCTAYSLSRPVIYINMLGEERILSRIREDIRKVPGVHSAYYPDNYEYGMWFLEVFSDQADKAYGAKRLQRIVGADRLIAFGDNYNDAEMLREADLSIAVENAPEEIRRMADFTIGPHDSDAVAKTLALLAEVYGM